MKWVIILFLICLTLFGASYISINQSIEVSEEGQFIDLSLLPKIPRNNSTTDLAFLGDAMFDRHIRVKANSTSYDTLLEQLSETLSTFDAVVLNLEGPVTDYPTKSTYNQNDPNHYVFTFDTKIIPTLLKNNISIVNLDNNHILNFGRAGLEETKQHLASTSISYFGDPYDRKPVYKEINKNDFAFISFNQFINPDKEETLELIREAKSHKDNPFIIIYTHWGNEYEIKPNAYQTDLAHSFIDNGADIVIGSHPHVVQQKEIYNGKYIYYSLGNFVFDQYFNDDVRCGAMVIVKISPKDKSYTTQEFFTHLETNGRTTMSSCLEEVPNMVKV